MMRWHICSTQEPCTFNLWFFLYKFGSKTNHEQRSRKVKNNSKVAPKHTNKKFTIFQAVGTIFHQHEENLYS